MKKKLIKTEDLCAGCNSCARDCPTGLANVSYRDESGNVKVKVDHTKCINCEIREAASKDSLTEIYNGRCFVELSLAQMDRLLRSNGRGFIGIFKIDRFEHISKTYGSTAANTVIRETAQKIKRMVRPYDLFGRYGEDEFIIFVLDIEKSNAMKVIGRIHDEINKKPVLFDGKAIPVTASFGVAAAAPFNDLNMATQKAKEALCQAQDGSYNRIVIYEEN